MDSLQFEDLIQLLKAEYRHYLQLKELADQKKEAIVDNNVDSLSDLIKKEENIIGELQDMEEDRTALIVDMAGQNEIDTEDFHFSNIIETSPEDLQEDLIDIREKLLVVIDDLHEQNQQNRMLLEEAMKLNKFSLNVMMKFLEPDSHIYEQKPGKSEGNKTVHIVDRKG